MALVTVSGLVVVLAIFGLTIVQDGDFLDISFEAVSAFGAGVAYAGKCENLGRDVAMPDDALLTDADLTPGAPWRNRIATAQDAPFALPAETRQAIVAHVRAHLDGLLGAAALAGS